ncbi:MAG: hypothetical protein QM778_34740 [Myxococcales bacterium]
MAVAVLPTHHSEPVERARHQLAAQRRVHNDRDVKYKLVDVFASGGLWDQRNNSSPFASFGSFAGDTTGGCGSGAIRCNTHAAKAPWGWDDGNDGPRRGELATDPVKLVVAYFNIPETVSRTYTYNPYR